MSTHVRKLFERGSPKFWRALPRPHKRTREARQKFGERSRVPLQGRPRRGRAFPSRSWGSHSGALEDDMILIINI